MYGLWTRRFIFSLEIAPSNPLMTQITLTINDQQHTGLKTHLHPNHCHHLAYKTLSSPNAS
ncbi:hypothetical protein HDF17_001680 [Granulicella arctica]|uniref:Uncharacterized protein n=1 Tax=Granulicella arctica TaxID=940613 RepID=A0A7Y9TSV9_9BACT|nr:hypothetical protein [Granulicella arctica]